mmetsp:Transcript_8817/g.33265  ORF Transcript_8817/g.33265 Transcript_8817/m.33265 type:complete len:263 (-) Transcript_8817:1158-1946(-)
MKQAKRSKATCCMGKSVVQLWRKRKTRTQALATWRTTQARVARPRTPLAGKAKPKSACPGDETRSARTNWTSMLWTWKLMSRGRPQPLPCTVSRAPRRAGRRVQRASSSVRSKPAAKMTMEQAKVTRRPVRAGRSGLRAQRRRRRSTSAIFSARPSRWRPKILKDTRSARARPCCGPRSSPRFWKKARRKGLGRSSTGPGTKARIRGGRNCRPSPATSTKTFRPNPSPTKMRCGESSGPRRRPRRSRLRSSPDEIRSSMLPS